MIGYIIVLVIMTAAVIAAVRVLLHTPTLPKPRKVDYGLIRRLEHDTHRPIEQLITEAENVAIREQNHLYAPGGIVTSNEACARAQLYAELDAQRRRTVTLTEPMEFRPACDDCEWDSTRICTLSGPIRRTWTRVQACDKHRDEKPTLRPIATRPSPARAPEWRL